MPHNNHHSQHCPRGSPPRGWGWSFACCAGAPGTSSPSSVAVCWGANVMAKHKPTTKRRTRKLAAQRYPSANAGAGRPNGVIANIVAMINQPKGTSKAEAVAKLVKLFPDRNPESMARTFSLNCFIYSRRKAKDEKRGLVYFGSTSKRVH